MQGKRMHPLKIFFSTFNLLKSTIFIPFFLFIVKYQDDSLFINGCRIAYAALLVAGTIVIIATWWKTNYKYKEGTVHIQSGIFVKKHRSVSLHDVQDLNWEMPYFYKLFHLTGLTLDTGSSQEDAIVKLKPIKQEEAAHIAAIYEKRKETGEEDPVGPEYTNSYQTVEVTNKEDHIYFRPGRTDLLKASFLSFSFLAIIPIVVFIYQQIEKVYDLDGQVEGILAFITSSWLIMVLLICLLTIIAVTFGVARIFIKYGKYEIASDEERIIIRNGVFDKRIFSIQKKKVQAVQINQSPLKKLLHLSEIELITAGGHDEAEEEISTLYPFLPNDKAYLLIEELLPDFTIESDMYRLPRKALLIRMLRLPWFWIITTILLFWLQPEWWLISPILFLMTYLSRFFDYKNTSYACKEACVQFKSGGLTTELFVTRREKIIEIKREQTILQRKLGLVTIEMFNRSNPVHSEMLQDTAAERSEAFMSWYQQSQPEIVVTGERLKR